MEAVEGPVDWAVASVVVLQVAVTAAILVEVVMEAGWAVAATAVSLVVVEKSEVGVAMGGAEVIVVAGAGKEVEVLEEATETGLPQSR